MPIAAAGDLLDIKCYLMNLDKTQVYNLGLAQQKVRWMRDESDTFLDDVLAVWLRREDDVNKKGGPRWSTLEKALRHKLLGQNGIAGDICRDASLQCILHLDTAFVVRM